MLIGAPPRIYGGKGLQAAYCYARSPASLTYAFASLSWYAWRSKLIAATADPLSAGEREVCVYRKL